MWCLGVCFSRFRLASMPCWASVYPLPVKSNAAFHLHPGVMEMDGGGARRQCGAVVSYSLGDKVPTFCPASPTCFLCVTWHFRASVSSSAKWIGLLCRLSEIIDAELSEQCLAHTGLFFPVYPRWENWRPEQLGEPLQPNTDPHTPLHAACFPNKLAFWWKQD